ncbi:auxin-responsive protein IAA18-like [Cornus florida]|uniref:auxin-responsive protein IAA18-like n=1 Tax=Cornus florida TaxID=4283 RepID=UPI0028A03D61|nr:auxin-responsive protein IAA18-like [Cornus florida]XP_059642124.1 auxin-responsive protein IAA18-like [Cornus florida]
MEGCSRKDAEHCPQLLDLIHKDREWLMQRDEERSHGSSEEKKLELRLGPPVEDWKIDSTERHEPLLSLGYFSNNSTNTSGSKRGFMDTVDRNRKSMEDSWLMTTNRSQTQKFSPPENPVGTVLSSPWSSSSTPQSLAVMAKESSQPCCSTKVVDLQNAEKKTFSPPSPKTAVPNSSQKRNAPAPVVGWPPIRSFRKNLASSSSSKPPPESQNVVLNKVACEKAKESCRKGLFVKINMDGIPIGRKVDLNAYDSYEKLSSAVDELFRDLLAAQREPSADGIQIKEGEKTITGLLDGSGEYTLVYEDNEGDRMLVGDVPWHIFVSTVKRLRVSKSSELRTLCFGSKQQKITPDAALK